jgi:hypothetical protein
LKVTIGAANYGFETLEIESNVSFDLKYCPTVRNYAIICQTTLSL